MTPMLCSLECRGWCRAEVAGSRSTLGDVQRSLGPFVVLLDGVAYGMAERASAAAVDVEGTIAFVLSEDLDALMAAQPTSAVRFLPGHDQWVMGPGTKDAHVVPPARRTMVTRRANLVLARGIVAGTWWAKGGEVVVTWFEENGAPPRNPWMSRPTDSRPSPVGHSA